jgi:YidC/Oxa1 family membrane protein insertase
MGEMEKRVILAAILMAAVLMLYQYLFAPPPPRPDGPPPKPEVTTPAPAASPPRPAPVPRAAPPVPERTARVEGPLYRALLTSRGGDLTGWDLAYRGDKPMVLQDWLGPRGVTVLRPGLPPGAVQFEFSAGSVRLDQWRPAGELRLVGEDEFGLRVTQVFRFRADSYLVERELRVENRHSVPQVAEIEVGWAAPVEWPKEQEAFAGPRPIHVVRLAPGSYWASREALGSAEPFLGPAQWVAFESGVAPTGQSGVYLTALVPRSPGMRVLVAPARAPAPPEGGPKSVTIGIRISPGELPPGGEWRGSLIAYLGPMEYDRLVAVGVGLEKGIYFGGFPVPESWANRYGAPTIPMQWIVVPIFWLMNLVYGVIRNYGIAIIVLTIVTKVLFYPLTLKSMRSMKAMQALAPQVNALRAKYQKDPQRLQRETLELYRKHKVNPLGGCLPIIIQIPIFYALYVALSVSAELQNAPFIRFGVLPSWVPWLGGQCVWICDLATYDPTYLLPILMGVSMFIQQKMMPTVGDPRQAKIMLMMPIFFTFFFLTLPSGLVLYWTVSNVLQIAQQYWIDRRGRTAAAPKKEPARA